MKKLKCIVVDDEPLAVSLLSSYVEKIEVLELVLATENPMDAIQYIQDNEVDLVFLDIQMPELSGINFMKIIGEKVHYVLTTAYAEYALEGYEHNVIDYLLKPISFSRFEKAVEKAKLRLISQTSIESHFFVKSSGQLHRILFDDILFIESIKDYVNIKTLQQEYIVLDTLKSMELQLPETQFARVHKSFIINLKTIKTIDSKQLCLNNNSEIPIGETFKQNLISKIK
ncbi:MAG: response regulator transcription factor [Chryseobacterium sp.]|nr:response regulator transcription factor [Candidatus Chryseobacterium enterohippi]